MRGLVRAADAGARKAWLWRNRSSFASSNPSHMPRLLIDVSTIRCQDAQTGIQRVVRALWSELSQRSGNGFVARPIYATSRHGYCYAPTNFLSASPRPFERQPVDMGSGDHFLGLDFSAHLLPKYVSQIRHWRTNGSKIHIVVYDLLPLRHPEWFSRPAAKHFARWFRVLEEEADQALCISDQVASLLEAKVGRSTRLQVGRVRMGGDIASSFPSSGICEAVTASISRMSSHPTILMVGTIEPRKGHDVALSAFEYLWENHPDAPELVIVGKRGWKTEALQQRIASHPEIGRRLHWLDAVTDEGLCRLYQGASAVFVPSRAEGFGLPLLEAAAYGRRILARDLPVFREQRIPGIRFFNDDRPESLANHLLDLLQADREPISPLFEFPTWSEGVERLLSDLGLGHGRPSTDQPLRWAS